MKHLRCRLTWLYTITASVILTLALTVLFLFQMRQTRQAQLDDFYQLWNSLCFRLQSDTVISHSYLSRTEARNQLLIHIEENGIPFFFSGSWTPPTDRKILIDTAKKLAEKQGVFTNVSPISSSSATSSLMHITGQSKDQYYARILVLAKKNGPQSLCVIYYRPSILKSLKKIIWGLGVVDLTGILCLAFVSWHFVGWSLIPVEENQRKQAEFIAAASHELRSPLAVLRSGISVILSAPQEKEVLMASMDSEFARLSSLIDDLLLLAAADAKTWQLHLEEADMDTLLIETYESFLPLCRQKQISLHLQLPSSPLPVLSVDPQRIRQILTILTDNALSYTPAGKSIHICAFFTSKALTLQVKDEGCGIPDNLKPFIFDRFYRADPSRSDKSHFGLGLSIARELTILHHAALTLSDNPKGGSVFSLTLPL
ncbi:MAG: HAMP domain-containing histidine kinase [Lachnospiraceae bacterium]|jgi:OmpR-family two-component system manganese-sensing sensor histidine kinase|nr:HAMP domain-containing histidine kinase [Lachnospiraceae bacterium]